MKKKTKPTPKMPRETIGFIVSRYDIKNIDSEFEFFRNQKDAISNADMYGEEDEEQFLYEVRFERIGKVKHTRQLTMDETPV